MRWLPLALLAAQALVGARAWQGQCGAQGGGAAADSPPPDVPAELAKLQAAVRARAPDSELMGATERLTAEWSRANDSLPLAHPALSAAALEALAVAGGLAEAAAYRGGLLVERGVLLQQLVRPEAALDALSAGAALLQHQLPHGTAAVATAAAAGPPAGASQAAALGMQRWAMQKLLKAIRVLQQLGQEELVAALLAPLPAAAQALPDAHIWVSAVGLLRNLTDEQLVQLQSCVVQLEAHAAAEPKRGPAGGAAADGAGRACGKDDAAPPTAACAWLHGFPHRRSFPLYYALHRGLHARKQYREAWAALRTAKRLHWAGTGLEHEPQENEATLADLALIFPPVQPGTAALRSTEAAGTETAKPPLGAEPAGRQQGEQQERRAGGRPGAVLQAVAGPVAAKLGRVARAWRAAADRAVERLAQLLRWGAGGPDDGGSSQACPASSQEAAAAPAVAEAASQEPAELRPIFVTGLPRSGTTLLEQILSRHAELHPDVWGAGERTPLSSVVAELLDDIAEKGVLSSGRLRELRQRYLAGLRAAMPAEAANVTWVVDKNLASSWHIGNIALMMPRACIVHAVRHPADAALSAYQQAFVPESIPWSFSLKELAERVGAHHRVMAHWEKALPGRVLDVHYSDVVRDVEGTTRCILAHCGLSWHPNMLRFYEQPRFVYTASLLQVRKPIYSSSLGKWQAYREGLAPLLLELRDTILVYEQRAGLPSSAGLLDELAAAAGRGPAAEQEAAAQRRAAGAHAHGGLHSAGVDLG